ncbi:MAG: response regulator [Planctomycetota bacterium]|jgi:two-component system chemotaxis response regulator CheY
MRILVVDDSKFARSVIRKVLGEIGYTFVQEASDGVEALAKLRKSSFDLVMTDWNMPRMDGIELVREVRGSRDLDVPVLMVSGESYVSRFVEFIRAGAQGYIRKPFTDGTLQKKIAEVMKKREMQQQSDPASALTGRLAEIGFAELVQFVASCSLSGRIVLDHEADGVPHRGTVELRAGEVVASFCDDKVGDDAVYRMAEWDDGEFRFEMETDAVEANTTLPTLPLLVEAMKRRKGPARWPAPGVLI